MRYDLIIDAANLINKIVFAGMYTLFDDPVKGSAEKQKVELWKSFAMVFSSIIKKHDKYLNNIVIAKDMKSWRKSFTPVVPISLMNTDDLNYKDNRKKDSAINWSEIFSVADSFWEYCSQFGVRVVGLDGCEADDIIYVYTALMSKNKRNTIIWSNDGDMFQLLNEYTVIFKPIKKDLAYLMLNEDTKSDFDNCANQLYGSAQKATVVKALYNNVNEVKSVTPFAEIFGKLVHGDKKDNVFPLYEWHNNGKFYKPTLPMALTALSEMDLTNESISIKHIYDDKWIKSFIENLLNVTKNKLNLKWIKKFLKELNGVENDKAIKIFRDKLFEETLIKVDIIHLSEYLNKLFNFKGKVKEYNNILADFTEHIRVLINFDVDHTMKVFKSNRKMLILNKSEIPENIVENILKSIGDQLNLKTNIKKISNFTNLIPSTLEMDKYFNTIDTEDKIPIVIDDVDDLVNNILNEYE